MSYFINNQQKVNELIFADRNKNYGAYVLRSDYGYTLIFSLFITALGIGGIMSIAYYYSNHLNESKPDHAGQVLKNEKIYTIQYEHKEIEAAKQNDKKVIPSKVNPDPQKNITNNVVVKDSLPTNITEANTVKPASESNSLSINNNGTDGTEGTTGGQGKSIAKVEAKKIQKDIDVDTPPEFEGGLSALYKFISQNLRYPSEAAEEGRSGTVYVNFVVDELGKIEEVNLLNKKGFGLDEEALRVVKLLPNFKSPAKVKGEAVKVYFQLPIKFALK